MFECINAYIIKKTGIGIDFQLNSPFVQCKKTIYLNYSILRGEGGGGGNRVSDLY